MLTVSGLAEEATPTPTPGEEASPTPEVEESPQVTETAELVETVTPEAEEATPSPTGEVEPTPEATEPPEVADTAAVTPTAVSEVVTPTLISTEEITPTEIAEPAPAVAEEVEGVQLTVYNYNLGLVKEIRTFALEEGENEVRYSNVASGIEPTSVHFASLTDPEGTVVLEQNYEYDLVSTRKLLQKYVDKEIALSTQQGTTYTGTLLSGSDDAILATEEGIKVIRLAQIQEFFFPEPAGRLDHQAHPGVAAPGQRGGRAADTGHLFDRGHRLASRLYRSAGGR